MRKRQKKKIINRPINTFSTCVHAFDPSGILVDFKNRKIVLVNDYAYTFQEIYDAANTLWKKNGKGNCPLTHSLYEVYEDGNSMFKPLVISHAIKGWERSLGEE